MVDLVATVAGLLLVSLTAVASAASLRIRGRAPFFVACLVLGAASIVLLVEALSFVEALTRAGLLVGQTLLAGVAAGAWSMTGRTRPPRLGRTSARELSDRASRHPAVSLLLAFAVVALLI